MTGTAKIGGTSYNVTATKTSPYYRGYLVGVDADVAVLGRDARTVARLAAAVSLQTKVNPPLLERVRACASLSASSEYGEEDVSQASKILEDYFT